MFDRVWFSLGSGDVNEGLVRENGLMEVNCEEINVVM